jgi:hypothetical protein
VLGQKARSSHARRAATDDGDLGVNFHHGLRASR